MFCQIHISIAFTRVSHFKSFLDLNNKEKKKNYIKTKYNNRTKNSTLVRRKNRAEQIEVAFIIFKFEYIVRTLRRIQEENTVDAASLQKCSLTQP